MRSTQTLKPDAKGRVYLGPLAAGISSYHLTYDEASGRIILEPYAEVPLQEAWLFKNKEALRRVRKGMKQSEGNKLKDRGSFAQYVKED